MQKNYEKFYIKMTTSKVATTATKCVCETPKKKKISKKQFNLCEAKYL